MNAKMDGYLTKPLITKELASTLRELNFTLHLQQQQLHSNSSTINEEGEEDDDDEESSTLSNISSGMDSSLSSNPLDHDDSKEKKPL